MEWHDAQFRGAAPGRYRLTIGDHVDVPVEYPLLQQGLGGDHQAVEKQTVAQFGRDVPGIRNLRKVPLDLNGVLVEPGEEDRWLVDVEPGKTYRFELIAARAGSPLDGVLTLYDQEGKNQLAMSDDQAKTSDGAIEYAVPKNIRHVTLAVKDLLERGGRAFTYLVTVTDAKAPSVEIVWPEEPVYLEAGGRLVLRGSLNRKNYSGSVRIELSGDLDGPRDDHADGFREFNRKMNELRHVREGEEPAWYWRRFFNVSEKQNEFLFEIDDRRASLGAYALHAQVASLDGDDAAKSVTGSGGRIESVARTFLSYYAGPLLGAVRILYPFPY
ncbi:MAG: hypothetical protein QM811_21265 [Pirellulales bacterium]